MKILFLHGWHSKPGGRKPIYLREQGQEVVNPSLCPDSFESALATAQQALENSRPDIVVGSSRGGAVAMNLKNLDVPLVLMCPAWKHWGAAETVGSRTRILHSPNDEIIDFSESVALQRASGLPESALVAVGYEHRLADLESLQALMRACRELTSPPQR